MVVTIAISVKELFRLKYPAQAMPGLKGAIQMYV